MARKIHEAAGYVFVQLFEQAPGIYDKSYPDHARQDKIDWFGKEFLISYPDHARQDKIDWFGKEFLMR
jgi:hypothetical protein